MIKKRNKPISLFIIITTCALLIFSSASVAFAAEKQYLIKEYNFETDYVDDLSYTPQEKIKKDGKTYKVASVEYKVIKDNTTKIKKKISTTNKNDYEKTIGHKLPSGKTIKLMIRNKVRWKEHLQAVTKEQEYKALSDVPEIIRDTKEDPAGNTIDIVLSLSETEPFTRVEKFSSPAKFYAYMETGVMYMFNGKKIMTAKDAPTWPSYEEDVKSYLGLNGSAYKITGGSWNDSFVPYGQEQYVRTATYTGTKSTPLIRATFTETDDTARMFVADITYVGYDPDNRSKACAVVSYERTIGTKEAIMIGAGIAIIVAALVAILYLIAKRRKEADV